MGFEAMVYESPTLEAVGGSGEALGGVRSDAIRQAAALIRELPEEEAVLALRLLQEFAGDGYLGRVRLHEIPTVKILAEVINGWEPDGVYEFARAWASTLVSREDGFNWDFCSREQKQAHRRRVLDELARRGLAFPSEHGL